MSVVKGHQQMSRFQSTRRVSSGTKPDGGIQEKGEDSAPKRTFGRTYLSRGFSGYKRPKRPARTGLFGRKMWSAEDELAGIPRRPQLAPANNGASAASSRKFVTHGVKAKGGWTKVPRRGEMSPHLRAPLQASQEIAVTGISGELTE